MYAYNDMCILSDDIYINVAVYTRSTIARFVYIAICIYIYVYVHIAIFVCIHVTTFIYKYMYTYNDI